MNAGNWIAEGEKPCQREIIEYYLYSAKGAIGGQIATFEVFGNTEGGNSLS